jgi:L-fucose mutarotase
VRCELPAASVARQTVLGRLLRIDGVGAPRAAQANLSVFPLDTFVDDAVLTAKQAYCVVATGERRFYGCFVFQRGVIPPN